MQRLPRRCWGTPDRLRCVRFPNTDVPSQTPTCLPRANDHAKFPAVKKHSGHSSRVVGLQAPGEKKTYMKDTTCSEFSLENEVLRRIFGQKRGNISAISLRLFEMFVSAIIVAAVARSIY